MNIRYQLKTPAKTHSLESRLDEMGKIRDWILELVDWDLSQFYIRYSSNNEQLIVWFEQDQHAVSFALKWC